MLTALAAPHAQAQQAGTPAFRVPMGTGQATSSSPPVHAWMESISECTSACGSGTRTTSYQCQNAADFDYSGAGYGAPEAEAFCTSSVGPKPSTTGTSCINYSGCGYDWVKPPVQQTPVQIETNPIGRIGCGQVRSVFSPYCQRTGGSSAVVLPSSDHRFCRNDTPDYNQVAAGDPDALGYDRTAPQYSACNPTDHEWRGGGGAWGEWSDTCSNSATRTRPITCYRKFDNVAVTDDKCDAASRPASFQTQGVYTSCSYDWTNATDAAWTAWSSTCSNSANRTRDPQCRRSNGDIVADASCVSAGKAKPSTSETQGVYSSCTYAAGGTIMNGAWSSQCSANAQRSVTRQCIRSNGDVVPDSECSSRSVALTSTQTQAVYDGCSYSFATGGWGAWSNTCSDSATRTRSVSCRRSDGTDVSDAECSNRGIGAPARSETQAVYDGCGYAAGGSTTYGAWNSRCSGNAQRSVTRQCIRSNGDVVASAECTNRGVAVTSVQTSAVYDQCGYSFSAGGWSDWNSHCSASATRTRSVQCYRADGSAMADAECTNRGVARPASSETTAVYDQCGYTPRDRGRSACTMQGQQEQYWDCTRADGATGFPAAMCGKSNPEIVSCTPPYTYAPHDHGVGACEPGNRRPHYWDCMRNDGQDGFPASYCGKSNPEYEACTYTTYAWNAGGWSNWNSGCSANATRTRAVWCQGSDGSTGSDAQCGGGRPASSETSAVYDQCSYNVAFGGWSACSNGSQNRTVTCTRSDDAGVDAGYCGVSAPGGVQTQSCTASCSWKAGAPVISGTASRARDWGNARSGAYGALREWIYEESSPTGGFGITEYYNAAPATSQITPACTISNNGQIRWRQQIFITSFGTNTGQASGMTCSCN